MTEISAELAGKLAAFVRNLASSSSSAPIFRQAAALAAELPAPVDPDLIEARKLADHHSERAGIKRPTPYSAGTYDHDEVVVALLAALKRGRELALSLDAESGK